MADHPDDAPQLTIQTNEDAAGVPLICLAGELDLATAPQVRAAGQAALGAGADRIVFELGGLEFMDSSGLRVLLEIASDASVRLRDASGAVRRVIESTGVETILKLES